MVTVIKININYTQSCVCVSPWVSTSGSWSHNRWVELHRRDGASLQGDWRHSLLCQEQRHRPSRERRLHGHIGAVWTRQGEWGVTLLPFHFSKFNPVQNRFRSCWAFTLHKLNRISELNGIRVIHLFEGVSNPFSFELVQIASVNAKGINASRTKCDLIDSSCRRQAW